ncbi:HAMP domain-containing methyl-accepting chemotaxis protein [Trichlorobacter sp.]|uniref:methyl-accepting chemotaxis protein n=1 Tax=Trichlorobacter sp. TaxID=2911007 RepID=UPI002A35ADFC|nr:HAMP domain-containing methyl-accepting chemotaxis protein [Trichlorobacter sp.]MDY0383613.1 HAMP domain-containing methyl-accepting chemotaxis protein [Trichlorobacter sp.]
MAKNLGFGTTLIRLLLVAGMVVSVAAFGIKQIPEDGLRFLHLLNVLFFLGVFFILATRKLPIRVKRLAGVMDQAAEGDLTVRGLDLSADEVGMLNSNFNEMLERLAGMMASIRRAAEELRTIGQTVDTVARQGVTNAETQTLAASSTKEAALQIRRSVEEVTTAVEGLSDAATVNASSIQQMTTSTVEINQLVEHLVLAVERVSDSIDRMANAQKEINNSVNRLLENSSHATDLVLEMDQSVRQIEQNAQATARISGDVLRDAELGNIAVETTINGMDQIRTSSHTVQQAIENLSVHAASIGTILQVIDEVTEQTKLLALNASIIAAQAGEHGKGFGVVAHEIKELARRTTASTREIAEIVNGVKDETDKAVTAIRLSEQAVGDGEVLSRRSGDALRKIVDGVKTATDQVTAIAHTTQLHAQQSDRMRTSVGEVASMVEQIVRASGEQTRDTEVINRSAENIRELVARVHLQTSAHNDAGSGVAESSETIVQMIEGIRAACQVQSTSSEQIVRAAGEMAATATGNLETTKLVEGAVSGLSNQIKNLEREVAGFKTST